MGFHSWRSSKSACRRGLRRMPRGAVASVHSTEHRKSPPGYSIAGRFLESLSSRPLALRPPRRPPFIIPTLPQRARVRQARWPFCRGRCADGHSPDCQAAPIHACRVGLGVGVRAGLARESGGPGGKGKGEGEVSLKVRMRRTAWASFKRKTLSARLRPSLIRTSSSSNTLAIWNWG